MMLPAPAEGLIVKTDIEALLRSWDLDQRREMLLLRSILGALATAAARCRMIDEMAQAVIEAAAPTAQEQTPPRRATERELENAIHAMRSNRSESPNGYQH